jgi:hypothetical protein
MLSKVMVLGKRIESLCGDIAPLALALLLPR